MASKLEAFLKGMAALEREGARLLIVPAEGVPLTVSVSELLYATSETKGLRLVLADGHEILTRPSESMASLSGRLAAHPNIARCHNSYLVNLDQVQRVWPASKGEYRMRLYSGQEVPLTMNFGPVMGYFGIESLDHVVPWNERQAAIIKEHLHLYEKDIRFMNADELRSHFSDGVGNLVYRQLMGNIIWQAYNWIQEGKIPPFDGNIRSIWYSHIKSPISKTRPPSDNDYKALTDLFSEYVGDLHLFRYADFGFVDDGGLAKAVGDRLPRIIFCAEKNGHYRFLQKVAAETGVSIIALGGQASLMTTEYFTEEMAKQGIDLDQRFYLLTDVDYDPSGNSIADAFRHQLRQMGVAEILRFDLIQPENFSAEEIEAFRYPVASDDPKKITKWLDKSISPFGGGLPGPDGQPAPDGLESDVMPRARLYDFAVAAIKVLAQATPDDTQDTLSERILQARPPLKGSLLPQEASGQALAL